jgi:hypothetical protein
VTGLWTGSSRILEIRSRTWPGANGSSALTIPSTAPPLKSSSPVTAALSPAGPNARPPSSPDASSYSTSASAGNPMAQGRRSGPNAPPSPLIGRANSHRNLPAGLDLRSS